MSQFFKISGIYSFATAAWGAKWKVFVCLVCMGYLPGVAISQENKTEFSGWVEEAAGGQPIPFASIVLIKDSVQTAVTTDSAGHFVFRDIPYGTYQLTITSLGYQTWRMRELPLEHQDMAPLHIQLKPSTVAIEEIVVKADQPIAQATRLSGGYTLTSEEVRRFPATFYDPARLATVYPGIVNVNDQANNLAIRGSGPNQMNFYINGAEIVNSNHLANAGTSTDRTTLSGGSVNMISAQLLQTTDIYTGVIPIDKPDATSGAMDYHLKRGSRSEFHFTGQAGLNGIDLAVEGPLGDRWSYIANYRYSTVGLLTQMGVDFGGEKILYQDLALQLSFYQNEQTTWQFFAMGGDNSNTFEAKADSLREEYKDFFDIDFKSKIGIAGGSVRTELSGRTTWNTTVVASTRWDRREQTSSSISAFYSKDDLELTKYALNSGMVQEVNDVVQLYYGLNATIWSGGLEYENQSVSDQRTTFYTKSLAVRPYLESQWTVREWKLRGGLGVGYHQLSETLHAEPKLAITRRLPKKQVLALNTGLQHKLQPYLALFSSENNAMLPLMKSWKSTLTYEKNFSNSAFKTTAFYEGLSNVGATAEGYSVLNMLEQYPPRNLSSHGEGQNMGVEMAYRHFLEQGLFYMISGTLLDARYKNVGQEKWRNSHYNNQYVLNATLGKEFDFSDSEKQKVLGVNFQVVYTGGFWETPIDLAASRQAKRTIRTTENLYSVQLPNVLKTYFRVYYKINHSRRYSLIGLDLSNVLNRNNVSYRYYDPLSDQVLDEYQLGLIPMLSYVVRI